MWWKRRFNLFQSMPFYYLQSPFLHAHVDVAEENLFARSLEWQVEIVYGITYSLYR
jgi:hypothetical protein